jgi:enamine deaminase RidA (YjgF/YER057c/UK114 family)
VTLAVLQPPGWPRPKGYANGMVGSGRFVLVAGQIGWDAEGRFAAGLAAQVGQALRNILAVLAEAGGGPEHIARLTWYVTDIPAYRAQAAALGPVWREVMGRHFPAMAVVGVTALVEPEALVEIEAIAVLSE